MSIQRRYDRTTKKLTSTEHLVAFLDILGFRQMLAKNELDRIFVLFEEISDTMYRELDRSFLLGLKPLVPNITNFSDSIILHVELDKTDSSQSLVWKYSLFFDLCRAIIATSLRLQIPIRGGISVGQLFTGVARSIVPKRVNRYGTGIATKEIFDRYGTESIFPKDWENHVLPPVTIPVHMGRALTEAYLVESSVNAIGVFLTDRIAADIPIIKELYETDRIVEQQIDGKTMYAINWSNYWEYDVFMEIVSFAKTQLTHEDPRVAAKWRSLVTFEEICQKKKYRWVQTEDS